MDPSNHLDDEEFIQKAMSVSPEEMHNNFKTDQQWFEEASNAIRQARKFQYLIHRQENVFFKRNIANNQQIINEKQHEVNDLKEQLKGIQQKIAVSKKNETDIKNNIQDTNAKASREMAIMTRKGIELQKLTD
jgi:septal ring factor EnvC (AmiA/AmiB activator)